MVFLHHKKEMKRAIERMVAVVVFVMVFAMAAVPASAKTIEKTVKNKFKNDWEKTAYDTKTARLHNLKMVYGFDTFLINEDYTHGTATVDDKNTKKYHKSSVKNARGTFKSKGVAYCYVSKIETRHKGSSVTYKVWNYKK